MIGKILILMIFIIAFNMVYAVDNINISKYSIKLIKKIGVGSNPGEIGYNADDYLKGAGPIPYVTTFGLSFNKHIIVPDHQNGRTNIYDLHLNFVKELNKNAVLNNTSYIKFDIFNNMIISNTHWKEMQKIKLFENILFDFKYSKIPSEALNGAYFTVGGKIFFYDDKLKIGCINENDEILGTEDSILALKEEEKRMIEEGLFNPDQYTKDILKVQNIEKKILLQ